MITLYMSLAGGLGAVTRFTADSLLRTVMGRDFPWGTLVINVTGSFILGVLTGALLSRHMDSSVGLIVGTGFCGGFTTFSTASFEAVRLIEERRLWATVFQVTGNFVLALAAAALGIWVV